MSIDGVCQTVVTIEANAPTFQAIQETLDKTTLAYLKLHQKVSVERSLKVGDEIGGHEVSGHVFGTAKIYRKTDAQDQVDLLIQCPLSWMRYIIEKGFIAVDGSSLTVGKVMPEQGLFALHLIPETLRLTRFSTKKEGDWVNIEFDHKTKTIVDSIERILATQNKII